MSETTLEEVVAPAAASSLRRILLGGSAWSFANSLVRMAVSFVSVPLTIGYLGKERYGLWMVVLSATAALTLLEAGLTPAVLNGLGRAHAEGDEKRFAEFVATGFWMGIILLVVALLLVVAAPRLDWARIFNVQDPVARREVLPLLQVVMLTAALSLGLASSEQVFAARLQLVKPRVYGLGSSILGLGLLVLGIEARASLPILVLMTSGPQALTRILLTAELIVRHPKYFAFPGRMNLIHFLTMAPSSALFVGIQSCAVVLSSTPNVLVAERLSLSDAGSFSVANRLFSIPVGLLGGVLPVFWPAFTQAWQRQDRSWIARTLGRVCLLSVGAMLVFGIGAIAFGGWFLRMWTAGRVSVPRSLLLALSVWSVAQAAIYWLSTFLHSISDFRFELLVYGLSALILLVSGPLLLARLDLTGIAVAMALALALGSLLPMIVRVRQHLARAS